MKNHPSVAAARKAYALFVACAVLLGAWMLIAAPSWMAFAAPLAFALAGYCGFRFHRLPQQGLAARLHNTALQLILRNKEDEAVALLDQIPARELRRGPVGVSVHTQRAMIAMRTGDLERALSLTTAGLDVPRSRGPFMKLPEDLHRGKARSLRAVCLASLGREADAESDAVVAETGLTVTPDVLARVSLARSIVLARRNDRHALAGHLQRTAGLMLQFLSPRERSLVRAFRRMARAQSANVYREPGRPDDVAPGAFVSWVGKVAPLAEEFAQEGPRESSRTEPVAADPTDVEAGPSSAISNVRRAHADAGKRMGVLTFGLWVVLVAALFGVFNLISPETIHRYHPAASTLAPAADGRGSFGTVVAVVLAVVVALIAFKIRTQRRQTERLFEADLTLARGDVRGAAAIMASLTNVASYSVGATAHLGLARIAERGARWDEVLTQCNGGIRRLLQYSTAKAVHADLLLPDLMATRAFALATLGREQEARAEMVVIGSEYPAYVGMGAAEFRVRLVSAVRTGDLQAARHVAMARTPDLALTIRDDLLVDVVLEATTALPASERERIEAELADDAELGAWIHAIAPDLRRRGRRRVDTSVEHAALAEAAPEEEEDDQGVEPRRSRAG